MRLGIVASHPIQYQAPLFRLLAKQSGVDLEVMFCHDHGVKPSFDSQFGQNVAFDVSLLGGYPHRFLRRFPDRAALSHALFVNPEIVSILVRQRFDAIVVHGYVHLTNALALALPRRGAQVLMRGESNLLPRRSTRLRIAKAMTLGVAFRRVDHFLAIGTLNAQFYEAYGVDPRRITVAPYSVDNAFFRERSLASQAAPGAARAQLGLPSDGVLFVFAGKLIPKKRPYDALRAFAGMQGGRRCGLVFVGSGELEAALKHESLGLGVSDRVHFLGFQNQSRLPAIYGACDVLVLPSAVEPWGLVVNEAMACGMGALVSDQVGSYPDLVIDRDSVFPVGDVSRLSSLMARLVDGSDSLAALKANALERIGHWGLDETVRGFLFGIERARSV